MLRLKVVLALLAVVALTGGVQAQLFYATNNLASANQGTNGDTLIIYDFSNATFADVGVVGSNLGGLGGLGGLDWECGVGCGDLITVDSFGAAPGTMYRVNPADATAVRIGVAPAALADLAYNPADGKMYGTDATDGLWRDDNGDSIPETFVGNYGIGALEVGLGFDDNGDLFVHDLISDTIYKSAGGAPGGVVPHDVLPFDSNFSQGLYVGGGVGYHGALNNSALTSENWSFDASAGGSYAFQSAFGINGVTGLPDVEVGDLTPVVPEPTSILMLLMGLSGLAALRR